MSLSLLFTSKKLASFRSECTMCSSWIVLTASNVCCSKPLTGMLEFYSENQNYTENMSYKVYLSENLQRISEKLRDSCTGQKSQSQTVSSGFSAPNFHFPLPYLLHCTESMFAKSITPYSSTIKMMKASSLMSSP